MRLVSESGSVSVCLSVLKGLFHEIDFKKFDRTLQKIGPSKGRGWFFNFLDFIMQKVNLLWLMPVWVGLIMLAIQVHRLEMPTILRVRSVMMVFWAQLAEGWGCLPSPLHSILLIHSGFVASGSYKDLSSIWPIALSYMSPNGGGGARSQPMSTAVHM